MVITVDNIDFNQRLKKRNESGLAKIWDLLDQVSDPEIPVLSLWDLGVLTQVEQTEGLLSVTLTPTYSGCPALESMKADVVKELSCNGYQSVDVKIKLSPAWSSNWISPDGRKKMREYGIAPPSQDYCSSPDFVSCKQGNEEMVLTIKCPYCNSLNTRQISEFGSTACKALHQCNDCLEPFDYFKSI